MSGHECYPNPERDPIQAALMFRQQWVIPGPAVLTRTNLWMAGDRTIFFLAQRSSLVEPNPLKNTLHL